MFARRVCPVKHCRYLNTCNPSGSGRCLNIRTLSTLAARFNNLISRSSSKYQIYVSTCDDPVVNLSIEHYMLQKSHPDSTIFFLYVNRPCVVIGRNQNPWLETNLHLLSTANAAARDNDTLGSTGRSSIIQLVRRRSGGGTVFHDHGNVNYSVICPTSAFTRDKHAEMIVQALRSETDRARVNERHDIVLDQGDLLPTSSRSLNTDYHTTGYDPSNFLKISGSAYKLTRTRSLHHGTCLVKSPGLESIGRYLRSPASPYIKARGVDSVRSPVGNVYAGTIRDSVREFEANAIAAFASMYGLNEVLNERLWDAGKTAFLDACGQIVIGRVGDELADIEDIATGIDEMKSLDWLFSQTPQFTFSTSPTEDDPRHRPTRPPSISDLTNIFLKFRSSAIVESAITIGLQGTATGKLSLDSSQLRGTKIHEIDSWEDALNSIGRAGIEPELQRVAHWLNDLFGKSNSLLSR